MNLDREELKNACLKVAKETIWDSQPLDAEMINTHAENLFKIATFREKFLIHRGVDPNVIVRAVYYLAESHAMPPYWDDTKWFDFSLHTLLELICPVTSVTPDVEPFFVDIEKGIAYSRENFVEEDED